VVELTNIERARQGVAPLTANVLLNRAAQKYAQVLAPGPCFDHNCGPVPNFAQRITNEGYVWSAAAENIAAGYQTPEAVVAGWMASSGHRNNIMNPLYRDIGVGVATGSGQYGIYWVQNFATPL
jgi:uncharacterized protein YkwD